MDRFRVKQPITGHGGEDVFKPGSVVTADQFPPNTDKAFLIRVGAIEVVGGGSPLSLLPDKPSEQDFRDEIDRLQTAFLAAQDELERVKADKAAVRTFNADPKGGVAADNLGKKLRDAEADRDAAERDLAAVRKENARLVQTGEKYAARLTELEAELAAAKTAQGKPADAAAVPKETPPKGK
jgi:hypothetical protein